MEKPSYLYTRVSLSPDWSPMCRRRPIFPGRFHPSIVGARKLNYRVRNGNGWTLAAINTDYGLSRGSPRGRGSRLKARRGGYAANGGEDGDPRENRTPVCGVRGRRLDRLTIGPGNGAPSGTRTRDPLIKSQLLYQLS